MHRVKRQLEAIKSENIYAIFTVWMSFEMRFKLNMGYYFWMYFQHFLLPIIFCIFVQNNII
jgi:hypothetical protein